MRRWLFVGLALAILTALFVWQWRAAAPLDVTDPAVRGRSEFNGLGPVDIALSAAEQPPHVVVVGQWAYEVVWSDSNAELVPETAENRIQQSSSPDDADNLFDTTRYLPRLEKRPLTTMARLRAWLSAD